MDSTIPAIIGLVFLVSIIALIFGLLDPRLVVTIGKKKTRGRVILTYNLIMILCFVVDAWFVPYPEISDSSSKERHPNKAKLSVSRKAKSTTVETVHRTPAVQNVNPDNRTDDEIAYKILDKDIYDSPVKTQVVLRVLVSGHVTSEGLKRLLSNLYTSVKKWKGFKYHSSPTHVFIYLYTSEEKAKSRMEKWVAMLASTGVNENPEISIDDAQIKNMYEEPVERFGLSEDKRKEIWREIVLLEDRSNSEAEQIVTLEPSSPLRVGQRIILSNPTALMPKFEPRDPMRALRDVQTLPRGTEIYIMRIRRKDGIPWYFVSVKIPGERYRKRGWINSMSLRGQFEQEQIERLKKKADIERRLVRKYKENLADKYGITLEQLEKISVEGIEKGWPFPSLETHK